MAAIYVRLIRLGIKTLEDAPESIRAEVGTLLNSND
jgi:hypothetical protein